MSVQSTRRAASEFTIGLAVCGAVYYFLIAPTERKADELHRQIVAVTKDTATGSNISVQQISELSQKTEQASRRIREGNHVAEDETDLFAAVTRLAEQTGVRIEQLQPTKVKPRSAPGSPTSTGQNPDSTVAHATEQREPFSAVEASLTLTGSYAGIAAFVDQLPKSTGFTAIRSLQVEPSDLPDVVRAQITTRHFAFTLPEIAAIAEPRTTFDKR